MNENLTDKQAAFIFTQGVSDDDVNRIAELLRMGYDLSIEPVENVLDDFDIILRKEGDSETF